MRGRIIDNVERQAHLGFAVTGANAMLLLLTLFVANSALAKSRRAEVGARRTAEALEQSANATVARNAQLAGGAELIHALDLAESIEETCMIISRYFGRLLPKLSGSLYLYRNSRDILERKAQWGAETDGCDALELCDCWGLRRGGQHFAEGAHALHCRHADSSVQPLPRLCLPLVAQGDVIGCITVVGAELAGPDGAMQKQFVVQLSEQVALSMSNAQLRLKLRQQSIIDPLTELYNRRYMDETLKRELQRARRRQSNLSLVLIDLDHFKRVNDTYGHDIGDDLLRKVSDVLRQGIRAVDIACRFGGEELVVILPDCDLNAAVLRAEQLRVAVAAIELGGKALTHTVTASFGVSCSSNGNDDVELMLRAADQALYTAKQTGRNRVVSAGLQAPAEAAALAVPETV